MAPPLAGVEIPVKDDVVDEPRGMIGALRDAVADIGEQIVVEVDVALARTETWGTRSGDAVRISAVAGTHGMIDVWLVEHRPLGGDLAIRADVVAGGNPELVASPTTGDVVENNVVVVAVGDFDVHGAGAGARGDMNIAGAEGARVKRLIFKDMLQTVDECFDAS
jgi:hypothetical protein